MKKNESLYRHMHVDSYNTIQTVPNPRHRSKIRSQSDLMSPLEYKFTSLRAIHHKKKINSKNNLEYYNKETPSRNYYSSYLNFSNHNPSTNISSYININKSNNTSNIFTNNESNSISTSPSNIISLPDLSGKKFIHEQNYGKLLLFNNNIREERYQNYFNKLLSDELYFRNENYGLKSNQFDITMFGRNISQNYFFSYLDTFNKYFRKLVQKTDIEKDNNEKLIMKENSLKTEINRLQQKKQKLLERFLTCLSYKKFLLHVKNKTLDYNKFKHDDLIQYLKDEERRELVLNDYEVVKSSNQNSSRKLTKRNSNAKKFFKGISRISININGSFTNKLNYSSIKNRKKSIIKVPNIKLEYEPIYNKPIFESVDDFEIVFEILNNELATYLTEYNAIRKQISPLLIERKELIKEIEIEKEKGKRLLNEELKSTIETLEILKEKNEELIEQKKTLIKKSYTSLEHNAIIKILNLKITNIFNYINNNYKNFDINDELEFKSNNPSLLRLKIIEKVANDLIFEKDIFIKKYPEDYHKFIIAINLREKLQNIEKRKEAEMEKQKKLIEKIIYNNNKILIFPTHKVYDKYDLTKLKKNQK